MCLHTINCAPFYFYRVTPVTSGERKRGRGSGSCRKEKEKATPVTSGERKRGRGGGSCRKEKEKEKGDARDLGRAEERQR